MHCVRSGLEDARALLVQATSLNWLHCIQDAAECYCGRVARNVPFFFVANYQVIQWGMLERT